MLPEPNAIRASLLEQHRRLREILASLVARLQTGEVTDLGAALDAVRREIETHNRVEQASLEPLLRWDYAWGPERIARMLEEHAAEHVLLCGLLDGDGSAARIADVVEEITAHMDAEERTFLSPRALRNEIVTSEDGD